MSVAKYPLMYVQKKIQFQGQRVSETHGENSN